MLETVGWIGSMAFALCGAPQAWYSYKQGHSDGISWAFLWLWIIGEVFTLIYVIPKEHWPLTFNYIGNILFTSVILYFKLKPRGESNGTSF